MTSKDSKDHALEPGKVLWRRLATELGPKNPHFLRCERRPSSKSLTRKQQNLLLTEMLRESSIGQNEDRVKQTSASVSTGHRNPMELTQETYSQNLV